MDLRLDDTAEAFRQEVRRSAAKSLAPHYQSDDKSAAFRRELLFDLAAMGLTGLRIPEDYGGQGATAVVAGTAAEEVARADFNATYVIINTALISDILVRRASEEQRRAWLPGIASGETLPCLGITEPGHGTDAATLEREAVPKGDGWRLHGEKTSITRRHGCRRRGRPGPAPAAGEAAASAPSGPTCTLRRSAAARSTTWGPVDRPFLAVLRRHACVADGPHGRGGRRVRLGHAGLRLLPREPRLPRAAQVSLEEALQWARDREAFGHPIGRYQGVAFLPAEAATYLRGARHVCYEALWRKDAGLEHTAEAAMAKFWAPKLAAEVIHQCLLTLGHGGYSTDSPIAQRLRDVIGLEIGDGTAQASKLVIARHLLGRTDAP